MLIKCVCLHVVCLVSMTVRLTATCVMQQSSTVRRIKDDAVAASHTIDAVQGNLPPSSSATAAADWEPAGSAMPSTTAANGRASIAVKPKAAAVFVKPKGPQVVVKAKRKAEDVPPDAAGSKSAKTEASGHGAISAGAGLMGLAAYGSDSGTGSGSDS